MVAVGTNIARKSALENHRVRGVISLARNRALMPAGAVPDVQLALSKIKSAMRKKTRYVHVREAGIVKRVRVTREGLGLIDTFAGPMLQFEFKLSDEWRRYEALVLARLDRSWSRPKFNNGPIFLRTDSGCVTGQVFHDETCECGKQLKLAMSLLQAHGEGLIVRIPEQDGRGMGRSFKLATLTLQELYGLDTVDSAELLSADGTIDRRTYSGVVAILKFFGLTAPRDIVLATNNPRKKTVFRENGYRIVATAPVKIPATPKTVRHLQAKKRRLGHHL
jgi:3,4-dihydroxy 2-butanone 4-phosphate synthase / GTP cyclohydrolase II